jgi:hypothetical protein
MTATQPIDVRDMAIVHRTFRKAYDESAQLVRAAPTPSPERVTFLADHIDFAILALHIHHEGEDELLYPKLIERVPEQAPMTEEVEREHEIIKTALDATSAACATWRQRPSAETGETLAVALDQLNAVAQRHLDDEEQKVVPLGEADRAFMMRSLPAPVRMLYPFLIERPWKKYASTLRTGT